MKIDAVRIYAEVLEQGLDFKEYLENIGFKGKILNIYTKKEHGEFVDTDSLVDRIRKVKDVDVLITAIVSECEYPILMVEYSTAVPTDDHKMQRADVYYWSSLFQVPVLKISPSTKGMGQAFGGGGRITDAQEQILAFNRGAILYHVNWDSIPGVDVLPTKKNSLSCIPRNQQLSDIISLIIKTFSDSCDRSVFYEALRNVYLKSHSAILNTVTVQSIKQNIVNSSRFHWFDGKQKLCVKINRFGHAMDPDRGVLYFANMLVGAQNTITEIQVNRPNDPKCRGGYNALFDALTKKYELLSYVKNIIQNQNNNFTDENALYILKRGLNIENALSFDKTGAHSYTIRDGVLRRFLRSSYGIVSKTIFFLSTKLILTDKDRKTICSVEWDIAPIQEYLSRINADKNAPILIKPLTNREAQEDVVTFASVELYKKLQCDLLAVSYPGAQGDRCILTGNGRSVLRTYVDIIAYKRTDNGIEVFLEECKDTFSKSSSDINKLHDIVESKEKTEGLKLLINKTIQYSTIIDEIYTAIAAKYSRSVPQSSVDYIFMFSLSSDNKHTYIDYTVAVVNTNLISLFSPLLNHGKLTGKLTYDKIFIIDKTDLSK